MKATVFFLITGFVFIMFSCSNDTTQDVNTAGNLYAIVTMSEGIPPLVSEEEGNSGIPPWIFEPSQLLFAGDDIVSFNISTGEMIFTDSISDKLDMRDFSLISTLTIYFNENPLFKPVLVISPISSISPDGFVKLNVRSIGYDELLNKYDNQFFLVDSRDPTSQTKEEWDIFIKYLSDAGKIVK